MASCDVTDDVIDDATDDVTVDVTDDVTDDVADDVTDDVADDVTDDVADDVTDDASDVFPQRAGGGVRRAMSHPHRLPSLPVSAHPQPRVRR